MTVILSGVAASRSEAATQSKDPYPSDTPSEVSRFLGGAADDLPVLQTRNLLHL
jgi:hypothetical protein